MSPKKKKITDLSQVEMEGVIEKLLMAGTDTIEKLAPHASELTDLFITYGLYQISKEAGINPFFGPVSYQMMIRPEAEVPEFKIGFGFGAAQVQIPASVRFMGVLGLASLGLAMGLSNLEMPGSSGRSVADEPSKTELEEIIVTHTVITDVIPPFTGTPPPAIQVFTTDWVGVENTITAIVKLAEVPSGFGYVKNELAKARNKTGFTNRLNSTQFDSMKGQVAESMSKSLKIIWDFEKRRRGLPP